MKWVVSTRNWDKFEEIEDIFADLPVTLISLRDFPDMGPVEETGSTLEENALLKARAAYVTTGIPAIADDTGLEVAALDGAPGVFSARFAGADATYQDNVARLLNLLEEVPPAERTARFRTCAAFVGPEGEITAEGQVEGSITRQPRGKGGFGYDSIFQPVDESRTFAQISMAEKQAGSHRGRAFNALYNLLAQSIHTTQIKETTT